MNVSVTDLSATRKELLVTVSGEEIAAEEQNLIQEFKNHAKLPGFRPGKAPDSVVRMRLRKQLQQELNRQMLQKVYQEAVVENEQFDLYSLVEFEHNEDFKPGTEANVDVTVDITPKFDLPEYVGLETSSPSTEVEDKEIDDTINNIRRQRADFEKVERAAAAGDYVQVSYTATFEGKPLKEQVEDSAAIRPFLDVEKTWEEAGTDEAREYGVPAIVDGLVGMAVGDEKEVEQTYADDFRVEALRGKTVQYKITVQEVRERILPELDEAFLKSLRVETVEELKDQILQQLEGRKKQQALQSQREQILDRLDQAISFDLPESGVEREKDQVLARVAQQNAQQGISAEEFEANREELEKEAREVAERDVKLQIVLVKIAEKEEIKVGDEDMSQAIYSIAMQQRRDPQEVVQELRSDRNRIIALQRQILFSKTLDFLLEKAKVTDNQPAAETEASE
ncbi:MAG: trigger factor [Verrucomicrobiota bacterium JB022]|nr:trigger factor [Verrucomicrobiota bacterium JB022]